KKNNPGCNAMGIGCCCQPASCVYVTEDFNRADSSDIDSGSAAGWTETSGSWAISGNELEATSAGIVICGSVHPDGVPTMVVEVEFEPTTNTSSCDVLVCVNSATDYYYARYIVGSDTIQIRHNNGGTHSTLTQLTGVVMDAGGRFTAKVCTTATSISAYI